MIRLPAAARGKKVRCKGCESVFTVPNEDEDDAPIRVKVKAKAAPVPPPPPPPDDDAPIGFAKEPEVKKPVDDDDDEDNPKPFSVITTDEAPRCPHCATELDPPDTKVCLNCGYNMQSRKRHASKKVEEHTGQDYLNWWMPAFIWIFVMLLILGIELFLILQMRNVVETEFDFLVKDDKNEVTKQSQYFLHPDCFTTFFSVITVAVFIFGVRFVFKRLIKEWKPPEVEVKT